MCRRLFLLLTLVLPLSTAAADLKVVATSPSLGALVREIAGPSVQLGVHQGVQLEVLAGPDRDLHALQVKPSMMRALRGADLVVAMGADLEIGWLPAVIANAANPKVLPGASGYFEATAQVPLLDAGGTADRALGDVHPIGNPHINMDPVRMAQVARELAERLALLDPQGASQYRAAAAAFALKVEGRLPAWRSRAAKAPGVVLYHRDAIYLLDRLDIPLLGTLEPLPGVPMTGRQLTELTSALTGRSGVILYAPYHSPQAPAALADRLGWQALQLGMEPPADADGDAYLRHIDRWVDALAAPRSPGQ